jgi:hypothetical protein
MYYVPLVYVNAVSVEFEFDGATMWAGKVSSDLAMFYNIQDHCKVLLLGDRFPISPEGGQFRPCHVYTMLLNAFLQ